MCSINRAELVRVSRVKYNKEEQSEHNNAVGRIERYLDFLDS